MDSDVIRDLEQFYLGQAVDDWDGLTDSALAYWGARLGRTEI